MSNPYFQFKQFTVYHDLCAMKVGTDGVLLGAWADCKQAKNILDIGTGSGLIALMLAQRSEARIHAVDIDENAYRQAKINFEKSPFSDRLIPEKAAFQHWNTPLKFDLLVSNPPYFSDSLKSPDNRRNFARHNDSLFFTDLIEKSSSLMNPGGKLAVILPFAGSQVFQSLASDNQLYPCRKTQVLSLPHKPPKRVLLEYSNQETDFSESILLIEKSPRIYTKEYIALTEPFYFRPFDPTIIIR
jgi:tRNA1Val (adenine37-N6)-methyltransferase